MVNKSKLIYLFTSFLFIIFSFYSESHAQTFSTKIKVGVIMKSGDLKNIARQDFFILDEDIISEWLKAYNTSFGIDKNLIENNIKQRSDFENKTKIYGQTIKASEENISSLNNKMNDLLKKKYELDINEFNRQYSLLKNHLESCMKIGKRWHLDKDFKLFYDWLIDNFNNYNELIGFEVGLKSKYENLLKENRSNDFIKKWQIQYEEFESITEPSFNKIVFTDITTEKIKAEILKNKEELDAIKNDEGSFRNKISIEIANTIYGLEQNKEIEFHEKFIKSIRSTFKTNLSGEASISLPKGKHFIVGFVKLIENEIIWNYPIFIEKDSQYIELSNDNALAINDALEIQKIKKLFGIQ